MAKKIDEPAKVVVSDAHDPYAIRTIEHLFSLFDGGDFLAEVLEGHRQLQIDMLEHKELHGTKGCKGSMTITVNYALGKQGDVDMGATVNFNAPKAPPSIRIRLHRRKRANDALQPADEAHARRCA